MRTAWQIFQWGPSYCYVALEYDEQGYTGREAYVNGYNDYPKLGNIRVIRVNESILRTRRSGQR